MKLEEINGGVNTQIAVNSIQGALRELGVTDLATYHAFHGDGREEFYVATDAGLYVARYTPRADPASERKLEGELTPWIDVAGARIITVGFTTGTEGATLTVSIAEPDMTATVPGHRDQKPLADFAAIVMRRQGAWMRPAAEEGSEAVEER